MEDQEQNLTKHQRRERRRQEKIVNRQKSDRRRQIIKWLSGSVVIFALAAGAYFLFSGGASSGNANQGQFADINENPYLGGREAEVVIIEYSDFTCPACAMAAPIAAQLVQEYGDQIKLVFNGMNLSHTWSQKSLEAGECAHQQGMFWEYAEILFSRRQEWNSAADVPERLKSLAREVGLSGGDFDDCLDSGRMAGEVANDTAAAREAGINATPTFYINEQKVVGAKPLEEFKRLIDQELAK